MDEQGTHEVEELTLSTGTVISRRRPKALWGVLAAVAVAAGALAVTSGGDDPAPALPIALGSSAEARSAAPTSADSSLAWITYIASGDLPSLGGEAPAYRLSGNVDEGQVRALADALGMSGDVVHDGSSWRVTAPGGATLEVYEGAGASWWYSSVSLDLPVSGEPSAGGSAEGSVTTLAAPPPAECDPDGSCSRLTVVDCEDVEAGDCPGEVPVPPADLPSEDEARAIALDLIDATGVNTDDAIVTVDGPYDAWYVTVEPRIDGVPSGLGASVSVGSKGAITHAGGTLGTPERLGDYPLLDTRAAIARLNEQMANGGGYYGGVGIAQAAVDTGGAVASSGDLLAVCAEEPDAVTTVPCEDTIDVPPPTSFECKVQADGTEICEGSTEPGIACPQLGAPEDQPLSDDQVIDCPVIDPMPLPTPEPMEIVLTGAAPTLVLIGANDGSADAYLVPGYRFTGENGEQIDAPAVADEALSGPATTEPPVTDTVTVEPPVPDPGGTDGGGIDPDCEPLVEGDASGTTHTIQPCVGIDPTEPTTSTVAAEG